MTSPAQSRAGWVQPAAPHRTRSPRVRSPRATEGFPGCAPVHTGCVGGGTEGTGKPAQNVHINPATADFERDNIMSMNSNHLPTDTNLDDTDGHAMRFRPVAPAGEGDLITETDTDTDGHAYRFRPVAPAGEGDLITETDTDTDGHAIRFRPVAPAGEGDLITETDTDTDGHACRYRP